MDQFETRASDGYHLKPFTLREFIDAKFMVWTHGEDSLNIIHLMLRFETILSSHMNTARDQFSKHSS